MGLGAAVEATSSTAVTVAVRTRRFAQSVRIEVPGYRPGDDYFHLLPGEVRQICLLPDNGALPARGVRGVVRALNSEKAVTVTLS